MVDIWSFCENFAMVSPNGNHARKLNFRKFCDSFASKLESSLFQNWNRLCLRTTIISASVPATVKLRALKTKTMRRGFQPRRGLYSLYSNTITWRVYNLRHLWRSTGTAPVHYIVYVHVPRGLHESLRVWALDACGPRSYERFSDFLVWEHLHESISPQAF